MSGGWKGAVEKPIEPRTRTPVAQSELVPVDVLTRAIAYIDEMPEAIEGENGSRACFNAARKMADFGLTEPQIVQVLRDHYNPRCKPEWSIEELEHKADAAVNKRREKNTIPDRPAPSNGKTNGKHVEPPPGRFDDEEPDPVPPDEDEAPANETESDEQHEQSQPPAPTRLADLLEPAIELAERRRTGEEKPVPLLFPTYAEILGGGLWPGVHTTVAGTGIGKSQFWFQNSLHAAGLGVPILYIGLELNQFQIALRLLGEQAGVSWSKLYIGRATETQIQKVRGAVAPLAALPFYLEFSPPNGWPASAMIARVEQIRRLHPSGPILVVLDFLQIVGADGVPGERTPELREAIKRAAYVGTHVGNKYGAAVVLVSSAARDKYGLLASTVDAAGLVSRKLPGFLAPKRTILNRDVLIGLGKESGEIEYSSESQTVLIRWPMPLDNGESAVICAVPKLRYGPPSWLALSFWQRFQEMQIADTSELPEVPKGGKAPVDEDQLSSRVKETIRANPKLTSKDAIATKTTGSKTKLLATVRDLLADGEIEIGKDGCRVVDG